MKPEPRHNLWFTAEEAAAVIRGRELDLTYRQIAYKIGRTHGSVKNFVARNLLSGRERIEWPIP